MSVDRRLSDGFWGSSQSWTLYDVTGSTSNFGNLGLTSINWLDSGANTPSSVRSGASFNVSQVGTDVLINYVAVPEPASLAILAAGGAIGLVMLRRRLRCDA